MHEQAQRTEVSQTSEGSELRQVSLRREGVERRGRESIGQEPARQPAQKRLRVGERDRVEVTALPAVKEDERAINEADVVGSCLDELLHGLARRHASTNPPGDQMSRCFLEEQQPRKQCPEEANPPWVERNGHEEQSRKRDAGSR